MTDQAIRDAFDPKPVQVAFSDLDDDKLPHPNTMYFEAYNSTHDKSTKMRVFSLGGGRIKIEGSDFIPPANVYKLNYFSDIKNYCLENNSRLSDYVFQTEGEEIKLFLSEIWDTMKTAIRRGLNTEGVLHGGLGVQRKAKFLFNQRHIDESPETK